MQISVLQAMASLPAILLHLALSSTLVSSGRIGARTAEIELPFLGWGNSSRSNKIDPSRVAQESWHPRAFLYKGFLSDEECEHLISLAHGKLEISMAAADQFGKKTSHRNNTTSGMFLHKGQLIRGYRALTSLREPLVTESYSDTSTRYLITGIETTATHTSHRVPICKDQIVERIEDKIAIWTLLPKENGEPMHIVHYGAEQKDKPYYDYYANESTTGGQRLALVLMYLSNVTQGSQTILPRPEFRDAQPKGETPSPCARAGSSVRPIKGNALLIFNLHPNMTEAHRSLHGSCPVLAGEKWMASKWIGVKAYHTIEDSGSSDSECTDEDKNCPQWAALGECQRNPVYMIGSPDYYGTCRKSCNVC